MPPARRVPRAECEPWAKTGGLADVVDALARALGRTGAVGGSAAVDDPGRRLPAALPHRPGPAGRSAARRPCACPDPRAPAGHSDVSVIDVAADGYRLRLVDHPAAFDREGLYGDAAGDYADNAWRFGLFCRAAFEALRADGRPVDVLHLHDWHTGPAALFRDERYADDPIIGRAAILLTIHNLAYHGWTPRAALGQLGLRPGDGIVAPAADGIDLLRVGIERAELVNTVSPGFARRGADAGLRDGPRRRPAREGRPVRRDPQRPRHRRLGSGDRRRHRRALLARRPGGQGGLPGGPARPGSASIRTTTGPVLGMIGRLDPQKGFDLRGVARRRGCSSAGARIVVQGSGHPELADPFRATGGGAPRAGRAHRAVRSRDGAADLRGLGLLPDAVAVRAVRPGPDDLAPLRDAAGRPPDRRPRRHGHRPDDATRGPGPASSSRRRPPTGCSRPASGRWRCGRPAAGRGRRCSIAGWRSTSTG